MRSIIFISAMIAAGSAIAEPQVPYGCYLREYSNAHLAKTPDQIVRSMALRIYKQPEFGETVADMNVLFADQGRIRGTQSANAFMDQVLICWTDATTFGCSVERDGGVFTVSRITQDSITI